MAHGINGNLCTIGPEHCADCRLDELMARMFDRHGMLSKTLEKTTSEEGKSAQLELFPGFDGQKRPHVTQCASFPQDLGFETWDEVRIAQNSRKTA